MGNGEAVGEERARDRGCGSDLERDHVSRGNVDGSKRDDTDRNTGDAGPPVPLPLGARGCPRRRWPRRGRLLRRIWSLLPVTAKRGAGTKTMLENGEMVYDGGRSGGDCGDGGGGKRITVDCLQREEADGEWPRKHRLMNRRRRPPAFDVVSKKCGVDFRPIRFAFAGSRGFTPLKTSNQLLLGVWTPRVVTTTRGDAQTCGDLPGVLAPLHKIKNSPTMRAPQQKHMQPQPL
ncbi:hypothetical protein BDK51DRAFT_47892 [Blyttiomyces helicus]|uniref:Uncharacterized protein n=1 Tax=Blyttiomyces helicus TaxID=388810 RepID=A0A4P9W1H1_9FUNG|nr:hypothetical protein BDK51DRAFT_47892 [Blyttiomyces helicus]|eukprot:RKO85512.1 hypothetical protein BDK51DRAFT_47892 [Blyttiomyces helicus]